MLGEVVVIMEYSIDCHRAWFVNVLSNGDLTEWFKTGVFLLVERAGRHTGEYRGRPHNR